MREQPKSSRTTVLTSSFSPSGVYAATVNEGQAQASRCLQTMKSSMYFPDRELFRHVKKRRANASNDQLSIRRASEEYTLEDDSRGEVNELHLKRKTGLSSDTSNNMEEEEEEEDEDDKDQDDGDKEDDVDQEDELEESRRKVSHGFYLVEGKMDHRMEDFIVAEKRKCDGNELGLYAIFDGHSGRKVAQYLQQHLFDNILSEPDFWTRPKHAIKRAYKKTDDEILDGVVSSRGGSTAVTAILINREKLIVANVGDSRAIMYENGKAKQITVDHEPQKERELVESRGGFVSQRQGNVPRVDGQLAMTRAFGDEKVKDHITSEPDVSIENINKDTEFVLLASDGVWKVMSNQEAADCIREIDDARVASKELIREALSRKSADDISCIVVKFR